MSGACGAAGAYSAVGVNEVVELIEVNAIVLVIAVNDGCHYTESDPLLSLNCAGVVVGCSGAIDVECIIMVALRAASRAP